MSEDNNGNRNSIKPAGNMNFRVGGYTGIGGMFLGNLHSALAG